MYLFSRLGNDSTSILSHLSLLFVLDPHILAPDRKGAISPCIKAIWFFWGKLYIFTLVIYSFPFIPDADCISLPCCSHYSVPIFFSLNDLCIQLFRIMVYLKLLVMLVAGRNWRFHSSTLKELIDLLLFGGRGERGSGNF